MASIHKDIPIDASAADVWTAAVADGCAVVVDVAGPVPLVIDGARLAALAGGGPVLPPQQDPDVQAAGRAAAAGLTGITALSLADGGAGSDLTVALTVAAGLPAGAAEQLAGVVAEKVRASLAEPYRLNIEQDGLAKSSMEHRCSASVGVSLACL